MRIASSSCPHFDQAGARVGHLGEGLRQTLALLGDLAGLAGRQVPGHHLVELGAIVLGDVALGDLGDQLIAAAQLGRAGE
jgi:hypothetical protein